ADAICSSTTSARAQEWKMSCLTGRSPATTATSDHRIAQLDKSPAEDHRAALSFTNHQRREGAASTYEQPGLRVGRVRLYCAIRITDSLMPPCHYRASRAHDHERQRRSQPVAQ